ncbi:MAG TPA: hypothetical protein VF912_16310 [Anaeromyxobacter sp.]
MSRTTAVLLLALASASARAQGPLEPSGRLPPVPPRPVVPPPPKDTPAEPGPSTPQRGTVLAEVSGKVREVDRKAHRIAIESEGAVVSLSFDRNTMIYTASGLGTVLDVVPGAQVRAGRNADLLAYWVQVRQPAGKGEPSPPPGQGTGPAGGSSAPASEPRGGAPGGVSPGTGGASPATPGPGAATAP